MMDLIPENPIQEKKTSKAKISFIIVIILIVILLIVAISIWLYTEKLKSQLFKVNIDNIYNSKASSEEGLFLFEKFDFIKLSKSSLLLFTVFLFFCYIKKNGG